MIIEDEVEVEVPVEELEVELEVEIEGMMEVVMRSSNLSINPIGSALTVVS